MAIPQVYGGTDVTMTVTFKLANGTVTDPTTVIFGYRPGPSAAMVESTYGVGDSTIQRVSTGVYSWIITTFTSGPQVLWEAQAQGIGVVNVVWPAQILVLAPPLTFS
jgi:hypothetical protein